MKRVGNLYGKIIDLENLREADKIARKGKNKSYGVRKFDENKDELFFKLHKNLSEMSFKTSKYHVFSMVTDAGKTREIYQLPYYPDRIVHHAIMRIMEPVWVSLFTADTYSCIKGRGIHGAFRKLKDDLRDKENTTYCLKLDIRKFYPTIDHNILKDIIRKKVKDTQLLALLDGIIDSAPGVPIGNYLSQFFANLYLTYFDHWLKEVKNVKYYYRYADDIVILHSEKEYLHNILADIKTYLKNELALEVKNTHQVFPVQSRGIDFVGYVFRHSHIRMRKSIKKSFARKAAMLKKKHRLTRRETETELCSYMGWAVHCNSKNLIKKIFKNEKNRVRQSA